MPAEPATYNEQVEVGKKTLKQRGKNPYYIEGDETIVEYKGGVQNILDQIDAGLRSSMSYMAATNLEQLTKNGSFVVKHNIS